MLTLLPEVLTAHCIEKVRGSKCHVDLSSPNNRQYIRADKAFRLGAAQVL